MVPQEKGPKNAPTRLDISVQGPEIDNGQDSQDFNFSIKKLDGKKAYDRNKTVVNSVRRPCKCCFEEFSSELELLEPDFPDNLKIYKTKTILKNSILFKPKYDFKNKILQRKSRIKSTSNSIKLSEYYVKA